MIDCKSKSFKAFLSTLFLGAFNDNLYKLIITLIAIKILTSPDATALFTSLVGLLFIVPFLLFSAFAGTLTDRFGKTKIIRVTKFCEILIMALTFFPFANNSLFLMAVILFCMASQSAFFGPAKYGIIPDLVREECLSEANGYVQMWTFVAIILGTACAGPLVSLSESSPLIVSLILVSIAVAGFVFSLRIPLVGGTTHAASHFGNSFKGAFAAFKHIRGESQLFLTFLAINYFWFLGAVFQMNGVLYIKNILNLSNISASALLSLVSIGVACGSILAGRLSDKKVEFGLVPLGAIGMCVFSFILGRTYESLLLAALSLFLLGSSAGFYIVPLNAFYQKACPSDKRGIYMANLNIANAIGIVLASVFVFLFGSVCKFNPAHMFLLLGICTVGTTFYIIKTLPMSLLRLINWIGAHTVYRIKIVDAHYFPKSGGALIVCNHVSYADPSLVLASLERPVRFLMFRELYESPLLKPIAQGMKVIPIAFNDRPKRIIESLEKAREAVLQGDIVCIFAEGGLTRTGNMQPFHKGFERIMKDVDAPIIPMYIDRIWGSLLSFEGGKYFWKWPKKIPYPITIQFGKPMPSTSKAHEVRLRVQELSAETFMHRGKNQTKLHVAFINEAKRHPFKFCMADSSTMKLNYIEALTSMLILSKHIFREPAPDDETYVGILLPSSCIAALINGAVLYAGKVPVNLNFTASQESLASSMRQCAMQKIITSRKFLEKIKMTESAGMICVEDLITGISAKEKMCMFLKLLCLPGFLIKKIFVQGNRDTIDDTATIIFSSGSTGDPKGVMLSHRNIFSNIEGLYQILQIQKNDLVMGVLPFFHSFGFTATMCFPLGVGVGVVYHANPMDAETIGKLVKKYKATHLMGTPTFLSAYIRKCTPEHFRSLRYVVAGAEKLKESIARSFAEKFGLIPYEGYGATELSPIVSMGVPDYVSEKERIKQAGHKAESVGHPIPGVAVKIVNQESGELMGPDEKGLLMIKGPNVMNGYLNNPEKTNEVLHDGWYKTGDLASIDNDGFLHILDRLSRFSKIGGEMVPHVKIETEMLAILKTTDQLCVVTSVPDEKRGERLAVLYVEGVDPELLWRELNMGELPKLWIPKREDFVKVSEIPLLGSGKLDLKKIKECAVAALMKEEGK
jgi:acyl-[acyl-carrier-protein]-phospholipid O-acyltransferase/long-chain-fatty-acid--[acyl-carrier-protein] ligase